MIETPFLGRGGALFSGWKVIGVKKKSFFGLPIWLIILSLYLAGGCGGGGESSSSADGVVSLIAIQDADGDAYDPNLDLSTVSFTLTGTYFGTSQASVNGAVQFINTADGEPTAAAITEWTNTAIQGTVPLPAGKFLVKVTARNDVPPEAVYFYKAQWFPMTSGTQNTLMGVWGSSATDVFAVGQLSTILHYTGASNGWEQMPIAYPIGYVRNLRAVWGASGTDVFAVGEYGAIFHYDGTEWRLMHDLGPNLWGVWGSSGTDVFAVGDNGTILHYDGNEWSAMNSGTTTTLFDIWGASSNDVYAVGVDSRIYHYDGISWSSTGPHAPEGLLSIWGFSGTDIFVGGWLGVILRHDGALWHGIYDRGGTFYALWGSAETDVYAVDRDGAMIHYNGSSWSSMTTGTSSQLHSVWGSSATDVFAVGDFGTIIHFHRP